jgi:hypothetical protein
MASYESQVLGLFADPKLVAEQVRQERNQQMPSGLTFLPAQTMFQGLSGISAALDPRTRNARVINQTAQETPGEFGTSGYYMELAERLRQKGMIQAAMALQGKAKEMKDDAVEAATAEFGKISFKDYGSYTVPIASLINQYAATTDRMQKERLYKQIAEAMQKGRAEVQTQDVADAREIERAKEKAGLEEKSRMTLLNKLGEERVASNNQAVLLQQIKSQIVDPIATGDIFTGPGASWRATGYAFMRVLFPNMGGPELGRKIGNTQAAAQTIGDALLGAIKQLGTNPSNADRDFIAQMLPQINQSPEAIQTIYQYMQEKALYAQEELNAREKYLNDPENTTLAGYIPPQAEKLNEILRSVGVDTSVENTRPDPRITSMGAIQVPVAVVKEDLSGPQINQLNTLLNSKGSNEAVHTFLTGLLNQSKITPDQAGILLYLQNVLYGGVQ